jgi:hypothetical protein
MENYAKTNEFFKTSNDSTTHPSLPLPQMHHQVALPQFTRLSSPWFHPNPTSFVALCMQPFLPSFLAALCP